jgi:two-component system chemotaxis response regulator CheB
MPPPRARTASRDIVVIGGSAGALQVVMEVARGLPAGFPAAVFVVLHTSPDSPGVLPTLLRRAGALPAALAEDRQAIERGRIYVAPPDHHLLIKRAHVRVIRGPKEHGFRPAVDPLFRTAARAYGSRVLGGVLSGGLNDGTHGLLQVTEQGGLAVVQDPEEAMVPSMPLSAVQNVEIHRVLPMSAMASALIELVGQPIAEEEPMNAEPEDVTEAEPSLRVGEPPGTPSHFTCPECGGALWELPVDSKLLRFRCHVGHAFTAESLLAEQESGLELALWTALRALEENASLYQRQAERAAAAGFSDLARRFGDNARDVGERADLLRGMIEREGDRVTAPTAGRPGGVPEPVEP